MVSLGVKTLCRLQLMQGKAENIMNLSFHIYTNINSKSYILRECKTLMYYVFASTMLI